MIKERCLKVWVERRESSFERKKSEKKSEKGVEREKADTGPVSAPLSVEHSKQHIIFFKHIKNMYI